MTTIDLIEDKIDLDLIELVCVRVWVAEGGVPYCNVNTMEMHHVQKNSRKNRCLPLVLVPTTTIKFCKNELDRAKVLLGIMMTMGALLLGNLLQVPQGKHRWIYSHANGGNCGVNYEGFKNW